MTNDRNQLKQLAANRAAERIKPGMVIGLGHGSTATLAVQRIGQLMATGHLADIVGVPASRFIAQEATRLGIPLTTLEEHPVVELTIDGADEVDPRLNVIKGGGGALLREKILAQASKTEIIIVDESKLSPMLGIKWHVPVEVATFGWGAHIPFLEALGATSRLRLADGSVPYVTNHGNYILDCNFGPIDDPKLLAEQLNQRAGIVEHGLFIGLVSEVIVAGADGVRELAAP